MKQSAAQKDIELDVMYNMATKFMNYDGPRTRKAMLQFANSSPAIAAKMGQYQQAMKGMAQKEPMKMDEGGDTFSYEGDVVPKFGETVKKTMDPVQSTVAKITEDPNQMIGTGTGQVTGTSGYTASSYRQYWLSSCVKSIF